MNDALDYVAVTRIRSRANPREDILIIEGDSSNDVQNAYFEAAGSICAPLNANLPKPTGDGKWVIWCRVPRNIHVAEPLRSIINTIETTTG